MLVLSRVRGESIIIGDDIEVTIIDIRHNGKVRLGIEAPKDITVHREEVYNAIQLAKEIEDNQCPPTE
jgi:carbon storage regulator